jgi:hypothetical protein
MNGLHVIKYPSGKFGFVGHVPQVLAHEGSPEDLETARICGPGLARKAAERNGRTFKTLVWETEAEAIAFAKSHGFTV